MPPPSPPGVYGPIELSKASVRTLSVILTSLHEQSAHRNVVWARLPTHSVPLPVDTVMGGPPPMHFAGGGPSAALGTQPPLTHPWPAGHGSLHAPQWFESVCRSTHCCAHSLRPGRQSS